MQAHYVGMLMLVHKCTHTHTHTHTYTHTHTHKHSHSHTYIHTHTHTHTHTHKHTHAPSCTKFVRPEKSGIVRDSWFRVRKIVANMGLMGNLGIVFSLLYSMRSSSRLG
jgi:ABC-type nickel/cobalt efflux system permease component RcnA